MDLNINEIFKKLTPAQAYCLMYRLTLNSEMLRLTFGDLIFRNFFEIETKKKLVDKITNTFAVYKYVKLKNIEDYSKISSFEKIFFIPFEEDISKIVQTKTYAKLIIEKLRENNEVFKNNLINHTNLSDFISTNFFSSFWDKRNSLGKKLGDKIIIFIEKKDIELKNEIKERNEENIIKIINELGRFILLLPSFNSKLIKHLKNIFTYETFTNYSDLNIYNSYWLSDMSSFDSISDSFDGFDGMGGDFGGAGADGDFGGDSGCSSCSSCSGCGGCGGCS